MVGGTETRYSSGKTRISSQIATQIISAINTHTHTHTHTHESELTLVSLFCGGLSVETKLAPYFNRIICNDKQPYLIALYQAVQSGWLPPDELTLDEYYRIKSNKDENPALTAFAGFGCSFGGKWFGGYGRHGNKDKHAQERSMCQESKRALIRDINILKDAEFICKDYKEVEIPDNSVVYADPPYKDKMAAYGIKENFDSEEFWEWAREVGKTHPLYISELTAPDDFEVIWERPVLRQIANCNADNFVTTEKLFKLVDNV